MGQPSLFAPSGEPIRFRTKKHLALLIYLTVEAKSHRRERLAELLWPKVSPTEGRHSLATALSTLRPRLGSQGLETSRDHVRLAPGRVDMDLDRLEAGDVLGTEVTGPLEVAAFLDGFDIIDSSEFNHWKDRQQARLLPAIKDALVVLIDRCRRTGDSRQIERLADRMLVLDELSEEAIRAKMEARAFAGDRLTALEFFEEWKKKLADELQAVPSDLVEGMAVRLRRRGWERTTSTNIPTVPTDQWRGRPFIGRATEYRVLYELWEAVQRGEPGHALILGDSGVGKTTLAEKLTTAAGLEGAAISRVQCYDLEREIPYSTVSSLILGLLDRPGVSATAPESLAELARTVPEVRHRFPNIPASSDSHGEAARIRLTEAFHEMLAMVAEEHPVILVVDDLHLADDVSLAVLHLMMRRARGQPIMVLLIARPGELQQASQAARLRESGAPLGIREIELAPLTQDESQDLLKFLLPPDQTQPGPAVRRTLLRAAAGFPMVLELLVQDWQANGDRSLALAVDGMTADFGTGCTPPAVYGQLLHKIKHSLNQTTNNVLNLAAILGPRLSDISMYTLADLSIAQTMTGMADLVSRRFVRDTGHGLEFVNELARTAVYLGVPSALRKVLHGHIADRFIEQEARGGKELGLEIAWHCIRAGRGEQATPYLLRGARDAIARGALHAAEYSLTTALPHLSGSARAEALLLLVEVLQEQGRWEESTYPLHDPILSPPHDLASVFSITADHYLAKWPVEKLIADGLTLHHIVQAAPDSATRVRAVRAAAHLYADLRDEHLCTSLLRSAESLSIDDLPPQRIDELELTKAQLLYHIRQRGDSLSRIIRLVNRLALSGTINSMVANLYCGLGAIHCVAGKYSEAYHEFLKAYDVASRLGNDTLRGALSAQLALCCGRLGDYKEQLAWSNTAFATFGVSFAGYTEIQAAYYASFAHVMTGYPKNAVDTMSRLRARVPSSIPPWLRQASLLFEADILQLTGEVAGALVAAREGLDYQSLTLHSDSFAGLFSRWLAMTSSAPDERRAAGICLDSIVSNLDRHDALDQVEVLCACVHLEARSSFGGVEMRMVLREKLAELPFPITDQLTRLGFLRF
jgi:DNA-binding SARP family transcriptional activator/type II secretory pathway predicted ATPase ExeA/tetratricopeptide (TPR) repeat protein